MNIFSLLKRDVRTIAEQIVGKVELLDNIVIEIPKDETHGELSTNAAMVLAKHMKTAPHILAEQIAEECMKLEYVVSATVARPGFINFSLKPSKWHENLAELFSNFEQFSAVNVGKGARVNVEYVSANPTGPMHIGHARGAVYGDALAALLAATGYNVTKEYYINDAGGQINVLVNSALLRYKEAITGTKITIPEGLYPGEYLIPVGKNLAAKYGDTLVHNSEEQNFTLVKDEVVNSMMELIIRDLAELGVEHEVFFSESTLHQNGSIGAAIDALEAQDLIYEGVLEAPKGEEKDEWEERTQKLFRSTDFGDDQDRALSKFDGSWTYFAADIAYARDKILRGFDKLIFILGADHGGYVKRITAVVSALSQGQVSSDIKLCQLVNFVEGGVPIKMSKRAGNFTTVHDVIAEMGKDVVRFIMLLRKNDATLDFDLVKLKEHNKDNPVFYVQYAHARAESIFARAQETAKDAYNTLSKSKVDLSFLVLPEEVKLIKLLSSWPKILESAAVHAEPHRIAFFLLEVASQFHSMWNLGKLNNDYKFIVENSSAITSARLVMIRALLNVLKHGFAIIGIEAPKSM